MSIPTIELVTHASVLVRQGQTGLLTDPWYSGPAFHNGWRLMHEPSEQQVADVLSRTTDIWISHEHPDHFSPAFFKRWGDTIRDAGIHIWFQKIADQRVAHFLRAQGFELTEMALGQAHQIGELTCVCLKDEFYDSLLSIRGGGRHILNVNDCNIADRPRAEEIKRAVGTCDILLTQFSYAAWKGGRENRTWREAAAREKLENVAVQADVLEPKMVIPFASFVRFAHKRNSYLNDAANTPADVVARFENAPFAVQVLAPGDVTDGTPDRAASDAAVAWWAANDASDRPLMGYESVDETALRDAFDNWITRIHQKNSVPSMTVAARLSPIRVLQPVTIFLDDVNQTWRVDPVRGRLEQTSDEPDLMMHSASLHFLFANSFGFDTLSVNGTFEEAREGGFSRAARSLAIENLNNLGLSFGPGLLLERQVIGAFFERLSKVRRRLRGA
ncbi:MBL fold metallo-hydrolase [Jannaschia aquimarina]|uniref:Beta-lactamase superfamily domain protein n=1 Tax=Jannaschia aquimarina TaxID=935700 RepID=A0A0D1EK03_9RHOB|nr:MBL fold metallo-hydrolase [Jannaschia aquimarina]KIT16145.1 hypothetical protein jaqu_21070 [Jannaschia aquimarina]SNT37186.1 L-ascorbate metabolism protein UlaG, beta-lactamase superfamily [Jannaschia aquimarina]